jgi:hypothetical protein
MRNITTSLIGFMAIIALSCMVSVHELQAQGPPCSNGWGSFDMTGVSSGQQFTQGSVVHVDYTWSFDTQNYCSWGNTTIKLLYSSDFGSTWNTLVDRLDWYSTSYDWTTPADLTPSSGYMIRIEETPDAGACSECAYNNEAYTQHSRSLKVAILQRSRRSHRHKLFARTQHLR